MTDSLTVFGTDFTGVTGIKAKGTGNGTLTYIRPTGTKSISANGTGIDVAAYASVDVTVPSGQPTLQAKTRTISAAGTFIDTPDAGYDGLSSVTTTVPSASPYIGDANTYFTLSGQRKWRHNFEVAVEVSEGDVPGWLPDGYSQSREYTCNAVPSNTTVTPSTSAQTIGGANYMMEGAVTVAAISTGTAGTPTATKGSVDASNCRVTVTPTVTNTTGYITGGTKTGTGVTVTAAELVAGNTLTADDSGTWNVTKCETLVIPSGATGTPSATKGQVSNHSISVTPSVTNTGGWISGGTKTGTAVSVTASELVSGSETKTANGTYDVTNLASLVVAIDYSTIYTSSSNPTSSQGSNGDIWLVTS